MVVQTKNAKKMSQCLIYSSLIFWPLIFDGENGSQTLQNNLRINFKVSNCVSYAVFFYNLSI
jgi:hypothetical protein